MQTVVTEINFYFYCTQYHYFYAMAAGRHGPSEMREIYFIRALTESLCVVRYNTWRSERQRNNENKNESDDDGRAEDAVKIDNTTNCRIIYSGRGRKNGSLDENAVACQRKHLNKLADLRRDFGGANPCREDFYWRLSGAL